MLEFKVERGERGQRGDRGEKCTQSDASDVLSVLNTHLPIQLAERYGEKMCFVKYHVSEDESSVVRMTGGVQTLCNVSAYKEPTWHFDAQFIDKQGHAKAEVQRAYHSRYDLVNNKVNAIYIVYKIRNYDGTGIEHNYLFPCEMGDNHRGICFLRDGKTMRVYGVADKFPYQEL